MATFVKGIERGKPSGQRLAAFGTLQHRQRGETGIRTVLPCGLTLVSLRGKAVAFGSCGFESHRCYRLTARH